MKSLSIVAIFAIAAIISYHHVAEGLPVEGQDGTASIEGRTGSLDVEGLQMEAQHTVIRQKRATCDLLSGFGVDHSACAAHCILRGRKGGYCNDQRVCVCRK